MNNQATAMPETPHLDPSMIAALSQYEDYLAAQLAGATSAPVEGKKVSEPLKAADSSTMHSAEVRHSANTRHTVDAIDAIGNGAVGTIDAGMNLPSANSFASLGAAAGMLGAMGKMGFASFAKSTADDLDRIMGVDMGIEEIEEAPVIEEPQIGVVAQTELSPQQKAMQQAAAVNLADVIAMHGMTEAKLGNTEYALGAGIEPELVAELDQNDIQLRDTSGVQANKGVAMAA